MDRSPWLRRLAHGACAGALLSCLRAPLGLDWTQLAQVSASSAVLFRAAGLLALALSLDSTRTALRAGLRPSWLAALAGGYAGHALVFDATPTSRAGYALLVVCATVLLCVLAGPRAASAPAELAPLERSERFGLALVGLGCTLALEMLAREARLFTSATRVEDGVLGSVFLLLLALAAAAFAPLLARVGRERTRCAAGLALGGASAVAGLAFLSTLTQDGLFSYLRRFDAFFEWGRTLDDLLGGRLGLAAIPTLGAASIGTLWVDAVLGAAALVVPAFLLGGTLGATRHAGRLRQVLFGAALGLMLLPALVRAHGRALTLAELGGVSFAWDLLAAGAATAAAGVALVAWSGPRPRAPALLLAAAVLLVPWARPRLVLWSFSPWAPARIDPLLAWPTPEGLLTVERARGGLSVLTLDRRLLTPPIEEEEQDARRLALSFALLPVERRAEPRTLLLGQLTPARARALALLGVRTLDRCAPWHGAMARVEELLFEGEAPPSGRILAPPEARGLLADGSYDWVVAPSVRGPLVSWRSEARELWGSADAPCLEALELRGETVGVAWVGGDSLARRGLAAAPLLVAPAQLESLAVGLVRGPARLDPSEVGPTFALAALDAPRPLAFLGTMPQQRQFMLEAAWTRSLSAEHAPELARGLALHAAAQTLSSPYETRAQQIELDEDALRAFFAGVPAPGALDALSREIWNALAWLFTEKRQPDFALVYLEPVAERFAPWPELDRAVGLAYLELLEPELAEPFLRRAREAQPYNIALWVEGARCAAEQGRPEERIALLEQALALQPGRIDLERELGLALHEAGDARGRPLLERALLHQPDDPAVLRALEQAGPGAPEGR